MKLLMYGMNRETILQENLKDYHIDYYKKSEQINDIIRFSGVKEVVILSDYFRNEYYLYVDEYEFSHGEFLRYLSKQNDKDLEELISDTYSKFNEDVIRHLYEISTGYSDSVRSNFEILETIDETLNFSKAAQTLGPVLKRLFKEAIDFSYSLKLKDSILPINKEKIISYLFMLKKQMGSLKNKDFIIVGKHPEIYYLSRLLIAADVQSVSIIHSEFHYEKKNKEIFEKFNKIEQSKIYIPTDQSIYYRVSKTDAVILNTSEMNILNDRFRKEIRKIRKTRKLQHLIDMSENPIKFIDDEYLDIKILDTQFNFSYSKEDESNAITVLDEEISNQVEKFMKVLKNINNSLDKNIVH